jgi:uncharacterized protein (TIGR01777 family)
VAWDGQTLERWAEELDGADVVVNLTGRIVDARPTPSNVAEMLRSRVDSVHALDLAVAKVGAPPPVWVQCASLAIYGDAGEQVCDETTPPGTHGPRHPVDVCRAWEGAFAAACLDGQRKVLLRIGFGLATEGGALEKLVGLARVGLGGTLGSGRQWQSWIHIDDLVAVVLRSLDDPTAEGTYNATGPGPVRQADLARAVRRRVHRPGIPMPAPLVRAGAVLLRTDPDLALTGRRAVPTRLEAEGFTFQHPNLDEALDDLLGPR